MYDFNLLEMDFEEAVTLLTQYAHECEPIGIDEVKELYKDEVLRTEIENNVSEYVYKYNDFLIENNCYDDILCESLDDLMPEATPEEVARAVFYGDYHYTYPYVRFNSYGNIKSLESYEVEREMAESEEFLEYLVENNADFNKEEYKDLIEATNKELRMEALRW